MSEKTMIVRWLRKFKGAGHNGDIGYVAELDKATAKKWILNEDVEKATEKDLKKYEEERRKKIATKPESEEDAINTGSEEGAP